MRRPVLIPLIAAVLGAPSAATTPAPLVLIAVVDSGITPSHQLYPELIVSGFNVMDGSTRTDDDFGHGNDVASTLLQDISSGASTSGICVECRLMPVKIAGASGVASSQTMAAGLRWATDHGARVINLSYGPFAFAPRNDLVESAISYALGRGVVVVLSAGNDGSADPAVNKHASDSPDALAVAAAVAPDRLVPRSNHGSWVALAAVADSTSLAAPHVAAAAADLLSWRPDLGRADVSRYLREGCSAAPALDVAWHCLVSPLGALGAAGFDPDRWAAVQVSFGGDGKGAVAAGDGSIDCGSVCAARVPTGTQVTLSAAPAAGSVFRGWSGACSGTFTCVVEVREPVDVTALFSLEQATLVVRRTAGGTVTSTPAGIACGRRCSAIFTLRPVRLVARAAPGHRFGRWGGSCHGTRPTCVLQMTGPRSVTARFARRT
jgi:subtilase family protein/List-Bact-rpt repeat protein